MGTIDILSHFILDTSGELSFLLFLYALDFLAHFISRLEFWSWIYALGFFAFHSSVVHSFLFRKVVVCFLFFYCTLVGYSTRVQR
ncbi:hypothetical protein HOY82DRAFT_557612 [Tuber indicum]|nr:hypothetical protein HOY82DRAFT_557612 [Tuber indicum]